MHNLLAMSKDELRDLFHAWGEPSFRAIQVQEWIYGKGATSFDEMLNLPKALRERLQTATTMGTLTTVAEQIASDGTVKRLYQLPDGQEIESVLMKYEDGRRTACISSQAGCAMGCVFCATGQMGFARHLRTDEIFEQALRFASELQRARERLSNVVLMGMGEPFHNYDAVLHAVRRLMTDLGIGARHITISTVGLVPQIRRFADEGLQVKLAISLHAATDEERSKLLPVNRRYPLSDLMDVCRYYADKTQRRISFEWALIEGKNDTPAHAKRLAKLFEGLPCHVNLIPLNPTTRYDGIPTDGQAATTFVDILQSHHIPATVRVRRGIDIDAGCGQLKAKLKSIQRNDTSSQIEDPV